MTADVLQLRLPHHNSGRFLAARWLPEVARGQGQLLRHAGWYVQRTCACHRDMVVSRQFGSEAEAQRCIRVMDEVHRRFPDLARPAPVHDRRRRSAAARTGSRARRKFEREIAMTVIRAVIDEQAFREMVAGRPAQVKIRPWPHGEDPPTHVEFILADIGWGRIEAAIDAAQREGKL